MKAALPLACAVLGNLLYHLAQKLTPAQVNPFLALAVSFGTASVGCALIYAATAGTAWRADASLLTWTSVALGVSVIVIESGFLLAYRSGMRIGLTALIVTISVTVLLLPVGRAFFGERLNWTGAAGVVVSLAGLSLLALQSAPAK